MGNLHMENWLRTELTLLNVFVDMCETTKEQESLIIKNYVSHTPHPEQPRR